MIDRFFPDKIFTTDNIFYHPVAKLTMLETAPDRHIPIENFIGDGLKYFALETETDLLEVYCLDKRAKRPFRIQEVGIMVTGTEIE